MNAAIDCFQQATVSVPYKDTLDIIEYIGGAWVGDPLELHKMNSCILSFIYACFVRLCVFVCVY